jgi:hypothetical protein
MDARQGGALLAVLAMLEDLDLPVRSMEAERLR